MKRRKIKKIRRGYYECPDCGARIIASINKLKRVMYICPKCNSVYSFDEEITT
jgi:predicted RNA-binding Zn-ribbon protein involved in translation (DUF1610 family)